MLWNLNRQDLYKGVLKLKAKLNKLKQSIKKLKKITVAFSGGVDSTFLLRVCKDVLGKENVMAVTASSGVLSEVELKEAKALALDMGVSHEIIQFDELEVLGFSDNPPERCYYCKRELFKKFLNFAQEKGYDNLVDGTNADDSGDFRPGMKALKELRIKSPLKEVGLTKEEIRALSKTLGLSTWDKPSFACLASRFPYGERISREKLKRVGEAEEVLRGLGFCQFRVRCHGDLARIEVLPSQLDKFFDIDLRNDIVDKFKELGFTYITLDMIGYRSGSLNEVLKEEDMASWKG